MCVDSILIVACRLMSLGCVFLGKAICNPGGPLSLLRQE